MSQRRNTRQKKFAPFASGFEADIFRELVKINPHNNVEYETERLTCIIIKEYVPDFIITMSSGKKIYIETKGYFPYEDQVKMLGVQRANPRKDIRLVFQKDNKLRKGSKTTYTDWARNNNFKYAVGSVPKRWLT